jgi:hypothetical protein
MPTFHLVVDEVVPVANHRFRVRVWRRADAQPIELLSQVQGHPPPDWHSSQLANLVGFQTPSDSPRPPANQDTRISLAG